MSLSKLRQGLMSKQSLFCFQSVKSVALFLLQRNLNPWNTGPAFPLKLPRECKLAWMFEWNYCLLFAFSETSCWCLWVVQVWPEPCMSSEWLNPLSWAQNADGKTEAKLLPCVSLANSCQSARRGRLRVKNKFLFNRLTTLLWKRSSVQCRRGRRNPLSRAPWPSRSCPA